MKNFVIFFIILFLNSGVVTSQNKIETYITEFANVEFPVESEKTVSEGETVFSATDHIGYYIISLRKFSESQDNAVLGDIKGFYQAFIEGNMDATNSEVVSMNELDFDGIPAIELEYAAPQNSVLPTKRFKKLIYVNRTIFNIEFWPLTDDEGLLNTTKSNFFNSLSFTSEAIKNTHLSNRNEIENIGTASKLGYTAGKIMATLVIIAIVFGLIFLPIYFISKKKRKKEEYNVVEAPSIISSDKVCTNCGFTNKSVSKYCNRCGYEMRDK